MEIPLPETIQIVLTENERGERLDRALAALLPGQSRSALSRLIDEGRVALDGVAILRPSHRVEPGATAVITLPDPVPSEAVSQDLPLRIVYQDADIAVVDKPAGLVVHPAAGHADRTLVNALLHHVRDLSGVGGELRPGIVHRLDRDTSGIMVVAKNDAAHRALTAAWGTTKVTKQYLALVYGSPREAGGTIDRPIARDPKDRKRMAIVASGRRAVTEWTLLEKLPFTALVRCRIRTGRTHQIRVHLKSIGHPIVGDTTYSGPQWHGVTEIRAQKLLKSMTRQALHAWKLSFPHPTTGEQLTFESPVPDDLRVVLEGLRELATSSK